MKNFLMLQGTIIIYTLSGVAAKYASHYSFLSEMFIFCYALEILILGVYAILWQQIIKRVDLSIAYLNRSLSLFWSMLWANLIFGDQITFRNIIGIVLIFTGTFIVNSRGLK